MTLYIPIPLNLLFWAGWCLLCGPTLFMGMAMGPGRNIRTSVLEKWGMVTMGLSILGAILLWVYAFHTLN